MGTTVIDEFLEHYSREYDFYLEAARLSAQQSEVVLESAGIRNIVTFRAKRPDRLRPKLLKRMPQKKYVTTADIYSDIPDLAGMRIALYFPSDAERVEKLIGENFVVEKIKRFPDGGPPAYAGHTRRFTGYGAAHYRVRLRSDLLVDAQRRYCDAKIEIQLASVLMHAWSEVEHDLVYKPMTGALSVDEYAVLDELNGLVLAGEISLERLQRAVQVRVGAQGERFANHYELAAHVYEEFRKVRAAESEPVMGRADVLLRFLQRAHLDQPELLSQFTATLNEDTRKRPLAEQIVDAVLASKPDLYATYSTVRDEMGDRNPYASVHDTSRTDGAASLAQSFVSTWIAFETMVKRLGRFRGIDISPKAMGANRTLSDLGVFQPTQIAALADVRTLRNNVVHGMSTYDPAQLAAAIHLLDDSIETMISALPDDQRAPSRQALRSHGWTGPGRAPVGFA